MLAHFLSHEIGPSIRIADKLISLKEQFADGGSEPGEVAPDRESEREEETPLASNAINGILRWRLVCGCTLLARGAGRGEPEAKVQRPALKSGRIVSVDGKDVFPRRRRPSLRAERRHVGRSHGHAEGGDPTEKLLLELRALRTEVRGEIVDRIVLGI